MNNTQFLKRNPSFKSAIHALELARRNPTPIVYQVLDECLAGNININTAVMKIQVYHNKSEG